MMYRCTIILLLVIIQMPVSSYSQVSTLLPKDIHLPFLASKESPVQSHSRFLNYRSEASTWFDVKYYRLDLSILPLRNKLQGSVTISGKSQSTGERFLVFDLSNNMQIDSVIIIGRSVPFNQYTASFDITLPQITAAGQGLSVQVYYQGNPQATGFGSFTFDSTSGFPWVYTLSEPTGAKDWWPCKDDPSDKADSADILVTCDSTLKVGSQGKCISKTFHPEGSVTYHWQERYPIASYLISLAITNYTQFSNWFRYSPTDSMEILNYVLPEHYTYALEQLPKTVDMLRIFSDLFGMYPFIKEKYGHAEFGRGGAMEHQTMTSMTSFSEEIISHELAHQWFGDMITCQTWDDLWLNEGFATYCSGLYYERKYGKKDFQSYMNNLSSRAQLAEGVLGIADTSSVRELFNSARVYSKGAYVLHMLRRVLGDSVFFRSLYVYANEPVLKYGTATTSDFQSACERTSGRNLQWFFQQWIYGDGVPRYYSSWTWKPTADSSFLEIEIDQMNKTSYPIYFSMPIDLRIIFPDGDTIITVWNNDKNQRFLFLCELKPLRVILDPDNWILKYSFENQDITPGTYSLEQNYPNPFNSSTRIIYRLRQQGKVELKIFDLLGRVVSVVVNQKQQSGTYEVSWNPYGLATGIYFYQLSVGELRLQKKMLYVK